MSHGRHRLFDAKRRGAFVRVMAGPHLSLLYVGKIQWPLPRPPHWVVTHV